MHKVDRRTLLKVFSAASVAGLSSHLLWQRQWRDDVVLEDFEDSNLDLNSSVQYLSTRAPDSKVWLREFQDQRKPETPEEKLQAYLQKMQQFEKSHHDDIYLDEGKYRLLARLSRTAIGNQQLYPGDALSPGSWSNPWSYEPMAYRTQQLLQGFTPVDPGQSPPSGALEAATRLIMPSIDIDSTVKELQILDVGDSRAYETPDRVVGHIPETANAGETGSSWFFGHTESPILGEGSVFFNLRKVPDKLRSGEDVFIITETGQHQYLYRVISSQVVHQDDMKLYDTGQATIHLVSCVPRLVYDHRLVITGELMGEKSIS